MSDSPTLGAREARPGLLLRSPDGNSPFKESDKDFLESRLELRIGELRVKKIDFSVDKLQAYVELQDEADIDKVQSTELAMGRNRPPLLMERFDLVEVWRPYLIARDLEEWIGKDMIAEHFEAEAGGAKVELVEIGERGREAKISFINPQVAMGFKSSTELFGLAVELELAYSSPAEKKDMVLEVKKLPLRRFPETKLKASLVRYFAKHTEYTAADCRIRNGIGYLSFKDKAAVSAILHSPPGVKFFAGTSLELSAVPVSQMLEAEEDPSSAFQRTYSSASEDTSGSITPSSSFDSTHMKKAFSGERSIDSTSSLYESQTMFCDTDISDVEASFNQHQRSLNSSSDGGILFSPPGTSGYPPRRNHSSSSNSLSRVPEHAPAGTSPGREYMSLQDIESHDFGFSSSSSLSSYDRTTKVLVQDVPAEGRNCTMLKYYLSSLTSSECEVKEYQNGKSFLATFRQPIDFQMLKEKCHEKPFMDSYQLSFCNMSDSANRKVRITFCDQSEHLMNEFTIKLHFERFTGRESIEKVQLLPPDKACVVFKNTQSVKKAFSDQDCQVIDDKSIYIEEYYDFMAQELDTHQEEVAALAPTHKSPTFDWNPIQYPVEEIKAAWLQANLQELNDALLPVKAKASVNSNPGSPLVITPLGGADGMSNWDKQVKEALQLFFLSSFKEYSQTLPKHGQEELWRYAKSMESPSVIVRFDNGVLILAGDCDTVDEVSATIQDMIHQRVKVLTEAREFPRKRVKYLKKFCGPRLENLAVQHYDLDCDQGVIRVDANEEARKAFWEAVEIEAGKMQEKSLKLTLQAFDLLSSYRGAAKIKEVLGTHPIECDLSQGPCNYKLFLFSPHKDAPLQSVKESLKKYTHCSTWQIQDPTKFRYCSDIKWKKMVDDLQEDIFVKVAFDDASKSVIVTGEQILVNGVLERIKLFIADQTRVQEQVKIPSHKWTVINRSFDNEITGINQNTGKDVKITWPPKGQLGNVTIVIKGDPVEVDRVKAEIEELQSKVCEKEVKLCNIPAAIQVVNSMEDKIRVLESTYGATIEVSLMSDDSGAAPTSSQPTCVPLCSATCPNNEVRISVYTGNFTKHNHVDAIVNFVPPNCGFQEDNVKQLFAAGGESLREDFKRKIARFLKQTPGDLFSCDRGKLPCGQLWHCFVLPWAGGNNNEQYYLEDALSKVLSKLRACYRILFTSICSNPLKYPADVFANNIVSAINGYQGVSNELTVAVYVEDMGQAREFEKQFKANNCRMTAQVQGSSRQSTTVSISSPISSFVTLVQGSLLQQQAEVYVNSTNRNLELNTGTLSKELLKVCGDDLQKKCTDQAPLKEEAVAITEAKNLKADSIYHVALPDYKTDIHASRKFRETVKAILRTANDNGVKSVAFPSLGVGNFHYPAQTSAKILFEEIFAFKARNRSSDMKFYCVVYDQSTYKEFSKDYAQRMNSAPPPKKSLKVSKKGSGSTQLSVVKSDISEEVTDIIVNTTTEEMKLNDGVVSKALLKKAGSILQQTCDQLVQSGLKLDHGQITDTKSFGSLKCKRIIHAHLPPRSEATKSGIDHRALIMEIVAKCLEKAEGLDVKSISFPAFGFGQGGYSVNEVAEPMLTAFRDFGRQGPKSVEVIRVVIFDPALHQKFFDFFLGFFKVDVTAWRKIVNTLHSILNPKGGHEERAVELQDGNPSAPIRPPPHGFEHATSQLLIFKIFAAADDKCDLIATKLRDSISEKCETCSVQSPLIAYLIDPDIEELKSIGSKYQVEVNVLAQIQKLEILGEKSLVNEAKLEIMRVMNDIEKSDDELKRFQWQSEGEKYSDEDSFKLERAKAKKLQVIEMVIDTIEVIVDLDRMEERSKTTGYVRKVMRVRIKKPLQLPKTWEPQPVDASGAESPMHMFDVDQSSPEYQEALQRFNATIGQTVTIVSLKRIQNPVEYGKHANLKDHIAKKYHQKSVDVRQLFHGSKGDSINLIAVQGFNRNFAADANAAYYGQGVYFAVNASYSAQNKYSAPNKDGHQCMFICQVIIGKYTLGKKGMKVAVQKDTNQAYDTLVENEANPTIFVAMTDAQAYPEYLVTFKKT